MGDFDSCRLIHGNLISFIIDPFTSSARIDFDLLYKTFYKGMRLADNLIDLEIEAIDRILKVVDESSYTEKQLWEQIKETTLRGRRAGLGFTGLADAIAMLGLKYDSPEGLAAVEEIMKVMFSAEMDSTIDLAILRGKFLNFDTDLEYDSNFEGKNDWFRWLKSEFPDKAERMRKHGRRNISINTVAPTGTVSIMAQCSSGVEPVFSPFYERKRKCMSPSDRVDFTDKMGINYSLFVVVHANLRKWAEQNGYVDMDTWSLDKWEEVFKLSPYFGSTAPEINWKQRVKLQGIIQKYITHSISSTINLANETTQEEIADIYIEAWKAGNKGQTIECMWH